MSDRITHDDCTHRFIDLANELKDEGIDPQVVSAALMSASGIYVTYVGTASNEAGLEPQGVDKVVALYRRNLEHIQRRKKEESEKAQPAAQDS